MYKRINLAYLFLFIFIEGAIVVLFLSKYEVRKVEFADSLISDARSKYSATIHSFGTLSENFFYNHAEKLAKEVAFAEHANSQRADEVRGRLMDEYSEFFKTQRLLGMEVLHLFDKEGNSFYRFHEPSLHGDPIYRQRFSLRHMREHFIYLEGLELGVFKESFRFQFPLFYDGLFVGSYEYGIGFDAIAREMQKQFGGDHLFLFKRSAVESIVMKKAYEERYGTANVDSDYLYLKKLQSSTGSSYGKCHLKSKVVKDGLKSDLPFVFFSDALNIASTIIFLPIYDISGEHIAFYVYSKSGNPLVNEQHDFLFEYITTTLLSIMILWMFYSIHRNRRYVRNILDLKKEMLVLTNGEVMKDVNQTTLRYFGLKDFRALKKVHACICDYFIEGDGYLSKSVDGMNWVAFIKKHREQTHKVKMADSKGVIHLFKLEYSDFEDNSDSIITFQDITLADEEYQRLKEHASLDALTGILNREHFDISLEKELQRAKRYHTYLSLLMFDIDHFKEVNDKYGHDVGDQVLKRLSLLIRHQMRDTDIFARWGGEEFMIITPNELTASRLLAEKLRHSIEETLFDTVGDITCSFGLSTYYEGDSVETITKRCDEALYSAKDAGRNCVRSNRQTLS